MTTRDLILAIDNGTQSLKALVFDLEGRLLAKESVSFRPYVSPKPTWAEQDPEVFWQALCAACQALWRRQTVSRNRIAGLALTTQRGTTINVDRKGCPLRPAILWLDQRKTFGLPAVGGFWGIIFRLAGLSQTVAYLQQEAEANWIRIHQPDLWRNTHKYLLLSGYLTFRLTGRFVDSIGCQVGYVPFDYKKQHWASSWDWKWRVLPIDPQLMPDLIAQAQPLGELTRQAAEATGLPTGLPVIAAAADKACEVIGSGALDSSIGCLSYGTTATINVTHRRYVEPVPLLPPYPAAVPGYYTVEAQVYRGYWMVNWFKEEFGDRERQQAAELGTEAEELLDGLLETVEPGSMGLILQPYWTPGLRMPGPEAKGAVIGFGDVHTRAHLYRAILEGIAYALRDGMERIQRRSRCGIASLRVSGGGSRSRHALQLTADIFGLPVSKPHLYETSGLGAAIDAAVGLGQHRDFTAAVNAMTRVDHVYEPDLAAHRVYDALYRDVYQRLYKRLKPLYQRIREITGYPQ
jgi:sugar (pentulose or hexulose) kinase